MFWLDMFCKAQSLATLWQGESVKPSICRRWVECGSPQFGRSTFWRMRATRLGMYTCQHKHIGVIGRNAEHAVITSQWQRHHAVSHRIKVTGYSEGSRIKVTPSEGSSNRKLLQHSPLEGSILFTKDEIPHRNDVRGSLLNHFATRCCRRAACISQGWD